MEMLFVEARLKRELSDEFIKKIEETLKPYKKVNVVCAIQFINQMNQLTERVKEKEFIIKQSKYRAMHPGQILGCDVYAADCEDCDVTVAFAQGYFHVLGIPIKYGKPVIVIDPEVEAIDFIDEKMAEKYKKRTLQGVGIALTAKNVMFVESTKSGQTYGVRLLKQALKEKGKNIYSVVADEVNFARLNEFRSVDIFISTACQRIAIDDMDKVDKPIINAEDLEPYFLK